MKNKIMTIGFLIIVFGLAAISIIKKDDEVSNFERRKLAQFPTKLDNRFTSKLDDYLVEQFPLRNQFITFNSDVNRNIFGKTDDKDVYIIDDNIYEINYPLNKNNCEKFTEKMNYITEKCFKNSKVYYSIIPDKAYFLDGTKYLKMDYEEMHNILIQNMNGKYIDITNKLDLSNYYRTDIHWKQENISKVVKSIVEGMGKNYIDIEYNQKVYDNFYGASYSKGNTRIQPDDLTYLYNQDMDNVTVKHLEYGDKKVYDVEKLSGVDAYDVFLSGPSSYIEMDNPKAINDDTLIVFRDSFGSSIVPLLTPYYTKIVVIDLRYIDFALIQEKLTYDNCDVLYLYSTLIINSSNILKVTAR